MAETGSGDSNYHEYIENVYVLSETLDGYEEISRTDGKRSNFFEYSNKENNYYTFSQMVGEINNWIDNNDLKCTLCQGHYDFFLFRFLLYICLLCRGIKVMPLIDCFHLLL